MLKNKDSKKRLSLDTETLRILDSDTLENVAGGNGAAAAGGWSISISISVGACKPCCDCQG
jgi:hypothetical protein